ncbi:hypothetical protein [Zunongwangia endophytica]|uniref:Uncharacterized protein n=1 Tax=Zunongwangia endophytica TaxID=1808945 RepID=A0ABV8H749_9FLAO|nr:hypothetical protein [Zunongwangia endophytica]MDN3594744.1 hypothetical protein [Zunongwangia endophytica]
MVTTNKIKRIEQFLETHDRVEAKLEFSFPLPKYESLVIILNSYAELELFSSYFQDFDLIAEEEYEEICNSSNYSVSAYPKFNLYAK